MNTRLSDLIDKLNEHRQFLRHKQTPQAARAACKTLCGALQQDPLVRKFYQHQRGSNNLKLTQPWMALAEQRTYALALASGAPLIFRGAPYKDEWMVRATVATHLMAAETYLWSDHIITALREYPLPPHIIDRDIMPYPFMYHTTVTGYTVGFVDAEGQSWVKGARDTTTNWLLLSYHPDGGMVAIHDLETVDAATGEIEHSLIFSGIQFGTHYPDDVEPEFREPLGRVLKKLAFLRSPYINVEPRKAPRSMRRHGGLSQEDQERTVNVVTLRKAAAQAVDEYERATPEFKHQWWVRGHFRSQWYPSKQAHDVIWIAPYLKGPEGAPMVQKVYRVIR